MDRIQRIEQAGGDSARAEAVALSQRYSVPSPFTSLLVLESEAMFTAFHIERPTAAPLFTGESLAQASYASAPGADAPTDSPMGELAGPAKRADALGSGGGGGAWAYADKDDPFGGAGMPARKAAPRPARIMPRAAPAATSAPGSVDLSVAATPPAPAEMARRPIGRWMKREWFRAASVSAPTPPVSSERVARARAALAAAPDDRAKYKELARALSLDGALGDLEEVVAKWTTRDPLDRDAITARSDLLARRGLREESLRVLSGVLGEPTALPGRDELALDRTLAKAFGRAGKAEACAFWIAAAELAPADVDAVAHAASCEQAEGRGAAAGRWLASLPEAARAKASTLVAQYEPQVRAREPASDRATWGDLVVDATWDEGADLDIVVIDPTGARHSWSSRSGSARVSDPRSSKHEALALTSWAGGPFMVELVRADGGDAAVPIHGRVRVRALGGSDGLNEGATDSREFVLAGARAQVARVDVRWDSRLVPTSAPVL